MRDICSPGESEVEKANRRAAGARNYRWTKTGWVPERKQRYLVPASGAVAGNSDRGCARSN